MSHKDLAATLISKVLMSQHVGIVLVCTVMVLVLSVLLLTAVTSQHSHLLVLEHSYELGTVM